MLDDHSAANRLAAVAALEKATELDAIYTPLTNLDLTL